jgi:hypothetical protein
VRVEREEEHSTAVAPSLSDLAAAAVAANPGLANPGLLDILLAQCPTSFLAPKAEPQRRHWSEAERKK